jgi:hypothetical protein
MCAQSSPPSGDGTAADSTAPTALASLREVLSVALLCDALDAAGFSHQAPRLEIQPITAPDVFLLGRCKTTLWAEMATRTPIPTSWSWPRSILAEPTTC